MTRIRRYFAIAQGDYIGQTSFYDAPHPWGPWTPFPTTTSTRDRDRGWANLGTAGGGSLAYTWSMHGPARTA